MKSILSAVLFASLSTASNLKHDFSSMRYAANSEIIFDCLTEYPIEEEGQHFYVAIEQKSANEFSLDAYWMIRTSREGHSKELIFSEPGSLLQNNDSFVFESSDQSGLKFRLEVFLDQPAGVFRFWSDYFEERDGNLIRQLRLMCRRYSDVMTSSME